VTGNDDKNLRKKNKQQTNSTADASVYFINTQLTIKFYFVSQQH